MVDQQVTWIKSMDDTWCDFYNLDLAHSHFDNLSGVYIIWHGGAAPNCVRVGQGYIRDRIAQHRNDPAINAYEKQCLFVTWAAVSENKIDGVEAFLANQYSPSVGQRFPDVKPISVNLPSRE